MPNLSPAAALLRAGALSERLGSGDATTTVLYGQVLVVLAITLSGVWQWTAAALGYQARLGAAWFELMGTPIYHPWRLFEWWFCFDAYAPEVFNVGGSIAAGSSLLALVVAIGMAIWRARKPGRSRPTARRAGPRMRCARPD